MEPYVKEQIRYGLKYVPANIFKSFFIPKQNDETRTMREKGFICGVCHPSDNYSLVKEAGIRWIRNDVPYPFEKDGKTVTQSFINYKERCTRFKENGLKVMTVTPIPRAFLEHGLDSRQPGDRAEIQRVIVFILEELRDCIGGIQISNEMGLPRFTHPLSTRESATFLGIQLEALAPVKGDIIVGYNCAGPSADLIHYMEPYNQYCDYIGVDVYLGCFFNAPGFFWIFKVLNRYFWSMTGKPVLMQEFGYISTGKPKTKKEKKAVLAKYGMKSEKDARLHPAELVERLNQTSRDYIRQLTDSNVSRYFDFVFKSDFNSHFYTELPPLTKIPGCEHTPEGQANFYRKVLKIFHDTPYVIGTIVYCWADSDKCYVCGQNDCPVETSWGLVDCNEKPKPSYYAVKEFFNTIKRFEL